MMLPKNMMNGIKLSKLPSGFESRYNNIFGGKAQSAAAMKDVGVTNRVDRDAVLSMRGGSITESVNSVIQNTNSMQAVKESISYVIQNYLLAPWGSTPPVTKLFVGLSFVITSLAAMFNGNEWPQELQFDVERTLQNAEIWRPLTSFLYLGPMGINYLLTLQFVWMYMAQLEKLLFQAPAEYIVMLLFGGLSLIGSYMVLDLPTRFLGHNLSTYLVYIWSKIFEGQDVNLMDLFTLKAEYLPWFFAAQTLLLEGEIPLMDVLGIGIGYVYHIVKDRTTALQWPTQLLAKYVFDQPWMKTIYAAGAAAN